MGSHSYQSDHEDDLESSTPFISEKDYRPTSSSKWYDSRIWMTTGILLVVVNLWVLAFSTWPTLGIRRGQCLETDSTEMTFPFEIPTFRRRFTGSPLFNNDGSSWRIEVDEKAEWPENRVYVGQPSHELDEAWEDLVANFSINLSEDEAVSLWGNDHHKYHNLVWGGYTGVLDVVHTLHCLDWVRKGLYPEHYSFDKVHSRVHLDHCVDYIRQSVLCHSSTVMLPSDYFQGLGTMYVNADQVHTCRDYRAIQDWNGKRQPGAELYKPRFENDPWQHLSDKN